MEDFQEKRCIQNESQTNGKGGMYSWFEFMYDVTFV